MADTSSGSLVKPGVAAPSDSVAFNGSVSNHASSKLTMKRRLSTSLSSPTKLQTSNPDSLGLKQQSPQESVLTSPTKVGRSEPGALHSLKKENASSPVGGKVHSKDAHHTSSPVGGKVHSKDAHHASSPVGGKVHKDGHSVEIGKSPKKDVLASLASAGKHAVELKKEHLSPTKPFTIKKETTSPSRPSLLKEQTKRSFKTSHDDSSSDDDVPLAQRKAAQSGQPPKKKVKATSSLPNRIHSDSDSDDVPLAQRKAAQSGQPLKKKAKPASTSLNRLQSDSDSDDVPLAQRAKALAKPKSSSHSSQSAHAKSPKTSKVAVKTEASSKTPTKAVKPVKPVKTESAQLKQKSVKRKSGDFDDSDDESLASMAKRVKKESSGKKVKRRKSSSGHEKNEKVTSRKKKEEEPKEVWKWWEEERLEDGVKWKTLAHKGPVLAPAYEPLPSHIKFYYDGKPYPLSEATEEVAGFFAKMLEHEYTTKDIFINNFWSDWRKEMTSEERSHIKVFSKCDFRKIHEYYKERSEQRKQRSKEEKAEEKKQNEALIAEYGFCLIDGHKERIGNFKIEPPGLFRGRGDHPKQGKLKRRLVPEDIIINVGKDAPVPPAPAGHKWKSVQHDNTVTWLASWTENINGQIKYIMLNATSKLKGEKDWQKYETARRLKDSVDKIREQYREDWKSKMMSIRQRSVAVYFIDKLALRAGHEKDPDESADTVGCCSLRVEHIRLHETWQDKEFVVEFDFLGKDSIRYQNHVPVEKQVFKNIKLFMRDKRDSDDLFDRLATTELNRHLSELMPGLTAKVFRTYNASITLQDQLGKLTSESDPVAAKVLCYNRANRAVAVLCNHQRAVSKGHDQQMETLQAKIDAKMEQIAGEQRALKKLKKEAKEVKTEKAKQAVDKQKKKIDRLEDQLQKLEVKATDKDENKAIALGTSKLNYLDPRISVAWCKKYDVPLEKVYNRTQREKFNWAIAMADETFVF